MSGTQGALPWCIINGTVQYECTVQYRCRIIIEEIKILHVANACGQTIDYYAIIILV